MNKAHTLKSLLLILAFGFIVFSCSEDSNVVDDLYASALSNPERPMKDRERDKNRKPDQVLSFFNVKPGDRVLDLFSSNGYYVEILNSIVGDDGRVIAHNNQSYLSYETDAIEKRYQGGRLENVDRYDVEANDIDLPEGFVDIAIMILSFHDLFYQPEDKSWPTIDEEKFLGAVFKALKKGGLVGIVDHVAPKGSDQTSGNVTHRISRDIVKNKMSAAGFVFSGETDILKNSEDDGARSMWEESIRGKTDRFVMRFRKPD